MNYREKKSERKNFRRDRGDGLITFPIILVNHCHTFWEPDERAMFRWTSFVYQCRESSATYRCLDAVNFFAASASSFRLYFRHCHVPDLLPAA